MAAFGWSVGDLVLAIRFVVKTGQALKDTGGASDDYQESIDFLHGVEATLKNLEAVARLSPTGAAVHSIAPQAERIQHCIKSFISSIAGYESSLGLDRKRGIHHGVWQKGKWSAFVSKKCKELQGKVAVVMSSINTNLSIQLLALVLRLESDLPTQVSGEVVNCLNGMLPIHLQTEFRAMRRILDGYRYNQETALASVTSSLSNIGLDRVHDAVVTQGEVQNSAHTGMKEAIAANTLEIRNLRTIAKATLLSQPSGRDAYRSLSRDEQTPWQALRLHLLKCTTLLALCLQEFFLEIIRILTPHILLFLRKVQLASSSLPLLLTGGDCVFFEDVLGRSKRLPYECFRHAEVFEAFIRSSFVDVPGKSEVGDNKFVLLTASGIKFTSRDWGRYAQPGMKVFMLIEKMMLVGEQGHCPRCWEVEDMSTFVTHSGGVTCSYCQLLYTRQPSTWNSEFWINALSKRRCKNPWKDTSTVDAGEQVHDFDNSLCNWVSTHFHQHMQDVSDETVAPVWHLGAIEDIDTDPCSKDESVALLDVVYYDEVHPFKRIHFTKAKDAHHCVERVMDLFVAISSLIVERDHQDSDFRSEISPIPTQFEQILQRLLSLRDLVLQGPHFPDHLNSVTVLISSLSTIRRLKPILASIRHSSRFTFDIFNIMDQFFREVNAIRVIHESFQLYSSGYSQSRKLGLLKNFETTDDLLHDDTLESIDPQMAQATGTLPPSSSTTTTYVPRPRQPSLCIRSVYFCLHCHFIAINGLKSNHYSSMRRILDCGQMSLKRNWCDVCTFYIRNNPSDSVIYAGLYIV